MCVVSNVYDNWNNNFPKKWPWITPVPGTTPQIDHNYFNSQEDLKKEIDSLKNEIEELKKLIKAAKEFDKNTGQPDCEMDEKMKLLKQIAKFLGIDLKDISK